MVQLITATQTLAATVESLIVQYPVTVFVVGNRTKSRTVQGILLNFGLPIELVDEHNSTVEGRVCFLRENTRGLAKLLPIGLRIPSRPFDDYVAVVLARRYLDVLRK